MEGSPLPPGKSAVAPPDAMADFKATLNEAAIDAVDGDLCLLITELFELVKVMESGALADAAGSCHVDDDDDALQREHFQAFDLFALFDGDLPVIIHRVTIIVIRS